MMIIDDRMRGLLLSLLVLLSLTACGGPTQRGSSGASPPAEPVTAPPATPPPAAPPTIPAVSPVNQAPTISGSPVTAGQTERPYAFMPIAADANGDRLAFSISGKPSWADFDAVTGALSGTPLDGSAGTYPGILISVSDGQLTTTLAPFSIAVSAAPTRTITLAWTAPTTNVDGSALTDLAGYVISYGLTPGAYTTTLSIVDAGLASVVIEGLEPGTWYFAMQAVNVPGTHSDYSNEAVAVL